MSAPGVSDAPPVVLRAEMPEDLQQAAFGIIRDGMEENRIEKDLATALKTHFDNEYGPTWHAVCGKNFGCSITHQTKLLLFWRQDQTYCLLFKSLE